MIRVIITGGPCTGKTTLVNALADKGYSIHEEIARKVIIEQLQINSNKVPWDDVTEFSKLVLKEQEADFTKAKNGINIYDRGIPDILGYLNFGKKNKFSALEKAVIKYRYNIVFILPPWKEIYENDNERREEFDAAQNLHHELLKVYESLNYRVIEVPKTSTDNRIQFILNHLNE